MNFQNLTKYKLSPVSKINNFSPQTIGVHNLENVLDEPLNFVYVKILMIYN